MNIQRCLISFIVAASLTVAQPNNPDAALGAARHLEEAEGNYPAAIQAYKKILAQYGKNRPLAAKALVRMGQCHEKLGDAEARKTYERVLLEFGDQKEAAEEARRHLAGKDALAQSGILAQRIFVDGFGGRLYRAISPDARYAVFSAPNEQGNLYTHDLRSGEVRQLMEPLQPRRTGGVAISPDGKRIAYVTTRPEAKLYVVDSDGANTRVLAEGKDIFLYLYGWSPDGKQLLAGTASQSAPPKVEWISVADGSSRTVDSLGCKQMEGKVLKCSGSGWEELSPDGRYVVGKGWTNQPGLRLASVDGGDPITLVDDEVYEPTWTPDGKRVLFSSERRGTNGVWSIRVTEGKPEGVPEMARDLGHWGSIIGFTRNGDLYHSFTPITRDLYIAELDPQTATMTGAPKRITDRNLNVAPAWSPDGESLAYYSQIGPDESAPGALKIVVRSMKSGEERTVSPKTPFVMNFTKPQWFPDGRSLFIQPLRNPQLLQVDVQAGDVQYLFKGERIDPGGNFGNAYAPGAILAPNGRFVCYPSGNERIVRRDLPDGPETVLYKLKGRQQPGPAISPDSSKIAFWESGKALMVVPSTGGAPVEVKTGLNLAPNFGTWGLHGPVQKPGTLLTRVNALAWSPDSSRIFFVTAPGGGELGSDEIWSVPVGGGEAKPLGIRLHSVWSMDLSPDGKRLAFYDDHFQRELWAVKNLFGEAKAKP